MQTAVEGAAHRRRLHEVGRGQRLQGEGQRVGKLGVDAAAVRQQPKAAIALDPGGSILQVQGVKVQPALMVHFGFDRQISDDIGIDVQVFRCQVHRKLGPVQAAIHGQCRLAGSVDGRPAHNGQHPGEILRRQGQFSGKHLVSHLKTTLPGQFNAVC